MQQAHTEPTSCAAVGLQMSPSTKRVSRLLSTPGVKILVPEIVWSVFGDCGLQDVVAILLHKSVFEGL